MSSDIMIGISRGLIANSEPEVRDITSRADLASSLEGASLYATETLDAQLTKLLCKLFQCSLC